MIKAKKPKSLPSIRRKLFKMASIKCREKAGFKCEICGLVNKALYNGKPQRIEAHHVMSRSNKNSPLKFDLRNLVALCTFHHKVGKRSAHKHGLWFALEFNKIRPNDAQWILEHTDSEVDLDDRSVLEYINNCLINNKPLDFVKTE